MPLAPGQLHSIQWHGDGTYNLAKVLAVDDSGVHVRVYAEVFDDRPAAVPDVLDVGSLYDGEAFGAGHVPVTFEQFDRWEPQLLASVTVEEDELADYHRWRAEAADSGYVGDETPGVLGRLAARLRRR